MSDKEWGRFFELVEKIVNLPGLPWTQKAALVKDKAVECGCEVNFEELIGWFQGE
jgi:hypothetical protein